MSPQQARLQDEASMGSSGAENGDGHECDASEARDIRKGGGGPSQSPAKDLEWRNLDVFATSNNSRETEVQLLHDVSGSAHVGETLALLGPSGSGKTTMMSTITGRHANIRVEGEISIGRHPVTKNAVRHIGYVPQDSMLFDGLTVWETVYYAACLRLQHTMTSEDKRQAATETIRQLGLERCQNVQVGGKNKKGISGGEKKRTSIATELVAKPSVLVLDEPTSGLDANIALRVVQTITELARNQPLCCVLTVHQPGSRIFQQFSKIMVLCRGRVLINGTPSTLAPKLAERGHQLPPETNTADFVLDVASADFNSKIVESTVDEELGRLLKLQKQEESENTSVRAAEDIHVSEANGHATNVKTKEKLVTKAPLQWEWPSTWLNELSTLTVRATKARSESFLDPIFIVQVTAVAIVCSLLWWQKASNFSPQNVQDTVGYIFFLCIFQSFVALFSAVSTYPSERSIVSLERVGGWYRLLPYFLSRTVVDIALNMLAPTIFVLITYFSVGLNTEASSFFKHYFALILNVLTAASLGLACAAIIMDSKKALTLATVLMLSSLLAGGFYVEELKSWMKWVNEASYLGHSFRIITTIEYPNGTEAQQYLPQPVQGADIGNEVGVLFTFFVGLRVVAFVSLRRSLRL